VEASLLNQILNHLFIDEFCGVYVVLQRAFKQTGVLGDHGHFASQALQINFANVDSINCD